MSEPLDSTVAAVAVARAARKAAHNTKHIRCPPPPCPAEVGLTLISLPWCTSLLKY
jgi:hypothetical protein